MEFKKPLLPINQFLRKFSYNLIIGIGIISLFLSMGMVGYHYFEKMSWIDSYMNAAMILSGMGPVAPMQSIGGKIFAATYALFSGIIFLVIIAIVFAPLIHRCLHKFHLDRNK